VEQVEEREADAEQEQQVGVEARHGLVDDELDVEGEGEGERLDHHREGEDLQHRALQAGEARPEAAQPHRGPVGDGAEAWCGGKLEGDPGEVRGHLRRREMHPAPGRVEHGEAPAPDALEHDEVVQVPVQDRRQRDAAEPFGLEPQRAAAEIELPGDVHQVAQPRPLERKAEALAHGVEVDPVAMMPRDHRQAGQPALGCLALQDGFQCGVRSTGRLKAAFSISTFSTEERTQPSLA